MTDTNYSIPPKTSVNTERELSFMTSNNHTAKKKKSYMNSQKTHNKNIMIFADNYIFHYWTEVINNLVIHSALSWRMEGNKRLLTELTALTTDSDCTPSLPLLPTICSGCLTRTERMSSSKPCNRSVASPAPCQQYTEFTRHFLLPICGL